MLARAAEIVSQHAIEPGNDQFNLYFSPAGMFAHLAVTVGGVSRRQLEQRILEDCRESDVEVQFVTPCQPKELSSTGVHVLPRRVRVATRSGREVLGFVAPGDPVESKPTWYAGNVFPPDIPNEGATLGAESQE